LVGRTEVQYKVATEADWQSASPARVDLLHAIISPVERLTLYDIRARHVTILGVPGAWSSIQDTAGDTVAWITNPSGANLLRNTLFQTGSDGLFYWTIVWAASSTSRTLTRQTIGAENVMRAAWGGADTSYIDALSVGYFGSPVDDAHVFRVRPGARYAVGVRLRAKTGNADTIGAYIRFYKADGSDSANKFASHAQFDGYLQWISTVGDTGWAYVDAPSDAAFAYYEVYVHKTSSASTAAGSADIDSPIVMCISDVQRLPPLFSPGAESTTGADVTAANTAAAIAGQGSLATTTPPTYGGNAAALAAGLVPGQAYHDSSDGNKLKTVVAAGGGFSVSLNRYSQTKTRSGAGSVTSDAYTATVAGGSGSYEYVWEQYYGPALSAISAPTSSSTTFSFSLGIGETKNAKIRLLVRDTTNNYSAVVLCGFTGVETS
jgi:hypothetical protein